jgi:1,4-dihydroxy-2-naphthoate polyprenyltransferase
MKLLSTIGLWIRATRASFFQAVIIPVILGASAAWYRTGRFLPGYFFLTLFGAIFINAGTNLANDYYDHITKNDELNKDYTPFNGGSRVIQEGLIPAPVILAVAISCFSCAAIIGLYLTYARGFALLVIGFIGILSGFFYTAGPVKIAYRGWGELLVGITCGPLVVLGAYYVQTRAMTVEAVVISLPVGILITAILYINEFPDYECDKAVNKKNLIVRLRPEKARIGFYIIMVCVYLSIGMGWLLGILPRAALVSLLTIPMALKASLVLHKEYNKGKRLVPAMAMTIFTHLLTGILLSGSYILGRIIDLS